MNRYIADMQDESRWDTAYGEWITYQGFYGNAACVEADGSFEEESFRVILGMGLTMDRGYGLRISRENGEIIVLLYEQTLRAQTLAYAWLKDLGIGLKPGQRFHLALRYEDGVFTVQLDNEQVLRYEVPEKIADETLGHCGYMVYPIRGGVTKVENFSVSGEDKALPAEGCESKPEPYFYEMEIGEEGTLPPCWMDAHEVQGFRVKGGALTSPAKGYAESLIYQFDYEPKLTVRFSVDALDAEDSEFGIILRKAPQTAFVEVGYSVEKGCWSVTDAPAVHDCYTQTFDGAPWKPELGKVYEARLISGDDTITLTIDGICVLSAAGLRQCNPGKTGLYANNAVWCVKGLEAEFASGVAPADGALSYCVDDDTFQASMEVEVAPNGDLVAITKETRYVSYDKGLNFQDAAEEYAGLDSKRYYQSILKLHDGSYIQVLCSQGGLVQRSEDLKNWKNIAVMPNGELLEQEEELFHTGSITEIQKPDGGWRLFLPVAVQTQQTDMPVFPGKAHDTYVYFSDDGGRTWEASSYVSGAFPQTKEGILVDWAESKVINCDDGTLRLHCSRNCSRFFTALISHDFGKTWGEVTPIRQIQCARASFGIAKDTENPNVWYMACVNGRLMKRGHLQHRTRLSLYRTENGREWEFLTDVDRFGTRFLDEPDMEKRPLYQIVDPAVTVDEDYIYVTWGAPIRGARGAVMVNSVANPAGSGRLSHNEQRSHLARFEKKKLKPQPWSAATVADMALLDADLSGEMW